MRQTNMQYTVILEPSPSGYGAYVPDLPGCIAAGQTLTEVRQLIKDAISFHLESLLEDGSAIPLPNSSSEIVEVHPV